MLGLSYKSVNALGLGSVFAMAAIVAVGKLSALCLILSVLLVLVLLISNHRVWLI